MIFFLARWAVNQQKQDGVNTSTSKQLILNLLLLGISISIGWTIPAFSERYYQELMEVKTQTYAASRFAALGFILTIGVLTGFVVSHLKARQWMLLAVIVMISSVSIPQNIESLIPEIVEELEVETFSKWTLKRFLKNNHAFK